MKFPLLKKFENKKKNFSSRVASFFTRLSIPSEMRFFFFWKIFSAGEIMKKKCKIKRSHWENFLKLFSILSHNFFPETQRDHLLKKTCQTLMPHTNSPAYVKKFLQLWKINTWFDKCVILESERKICHFHELFSYRL